MRIWVKQVWKCLAAGRREMPAELRAVALHFFSGKNARLKKKIYETKQNKNQSNEGKKKKQESLLGSFWLIVVGKSSCQSCSVAGALWTLAPEFRFLLFCCRGHCRAFLRKAAGSFLGTIGLLSRWLMRSIWVRHKWIRLLSFSSSFLSERILRQASRIREEISKNPNERRMKSSG